MHSILLLPRQNKLMIQTVIDPCQLHRTLCVEYGQKRCSLARPLGALLGCLGKFLNPAVVALVHTLCQENIGGVRLLLIRRVPLRISVLNLKACLRVYERQQALTA